jgi:hypothetical protein
MHFGTNYSETRYQKSCVLHILEHSKILSHKNTSLLLMFCTTSLLHLPNYGNET